MRGIKLKSNKELTKDKKIVIFDKPQYVYIPLICSNDEDITLKVRRGSNVLVGSVIGINNKWNIPIHSTVSGKVIDYEEKYIYNGKLIKTVKIENDFNDKTIEVDNLKEIDKYTKKEFIQILKDCGIRGMGGADFPTYIKYDTKKKIKNLIINAVECEPYITADYHVIKENVSQILETIDAIMTINKIEKAYFAIKKNNKSLINIINTIIGTYPNIQLVLTPDIYPIGWEKKLAQYVLKKTYDNLPSEIDTVINNVSTIYAIYNALKYKRPIINRLVTVAGDGLKKSSIVDVKIGQDVSEVLDKLGHKKKDLLFISGGPMMGKTISDDNFTITSNVNAILLLKDNDNEIVKTCIRCGKCASICPAKLSPILIKENINNKKELKQLNVSRCIECGLCSYICPAKILLRELVIRAKKNVGDE